jgi:hypothetical protein
MNKVERVKEFYNNGQDDKDYKIRNIYYSKKYDTWYVEFKYLPSIPFYEWLFNPKYKVFEVFKINSVILANNYKVVTHKWIYREPEEILTYLSKQTGGDNE